MTDNNDIEYIPLSYLSQYYYCPRRAALLMLECVWNENSLTAEGRFGHDSAHDERIEKRNGSIKIYEHTVYSQIYALSGKCDCIEGVVDSCGVILPFLALDSSRYLLTPVEYKHGRLRNEEEYNIQLCAQAMCLEEKYGGNITHGAVFYINAHRRAEVTFNGVIRQRVAEGAAALQKMLENRTIPQAVISKKCGKCSLCDYCLPQIKKIPSTYIKKMLISACETVNSETEKIDEETL